MDALEMTLLLDTYGGMLTKKQQEYMNLRYNQDLSLGEISQSLGVSRQAVFDNLCRSEAMLRRLEENVGCVRRDLSVRQAVDALRRALATLESAKDTTVPAATEAIHRALDLLEE